MRPRLGPTSILLAAVLLGATTIATRGERTLFGRTGPAPPEVAELPPLTREDRVLVLAPHEDDETLGAAGLIQQAVAAGASVRVVYLTYGDHNELAFLRYRKRPWLTPTINRQMGEVRRQEAIKAMTWLGVPAEQLVFFGYPDHGTLDIWYHHWANSVPFHSWLTRSRAVPYRDAASYGEPYKGDAILADLQRQLREFRPTRIFVTHPLDGNPDHRALCLFLEVALLDVADGLPTPPVYAYPVHMGSWPRPLGSHPDLWLPLPKARTEPAANWRMLVLSPAEANRKVEAIRFYRSQTADRRDWLSSFARRDELFLVLTPTELHAVSLPPRGAVATPETDAYERGQPRGNVASVTYRKSDQALIVEVTLHKPIEEAGGLYLDVFGYRHDRPFGSMPKLQIRLWDGDLDVVGVKDRRSEPPVQLERDDGRIRLLVPWELLGQAEAVFTQIQGLSGYLPVSHTGWRLLVRALPPVAAENRLKEMRP